MHFHNYTLEELSEMSDKNLVDLGVNIRIHRLKILELLKSCNTSETQINYTESEFSQCSFQDNFVCYDFTNNCSNSISLAPVSGLFSSIIFKVGELGAKIGRGTNTEIRIPDNFVSRRDCEIRYKK